MEGQDLRVYKVSQVASRTPPDVAEAYTKGCFPWLEELLFDNMPKWEEWDVVLDVGFPCLRRLTISICSELRRIPAFPSLQLLNIYKCEKLICIPQHMLKELRNLHLEACPKLQLLPDEWLPVWPEHVEIIDCPILQDWCHKHNFSYFQELSAIKELAISKSLEITSETSKRFPLLEYLSIRNCLQKHLPTYEWIPSSLKGLNLFRCNLLLWLHLHQNLSALQTLNISSCLELSSAVGLYNLPSLKHLSIRDCPEIRLFQDEWLPSTLQSLEISKCGNLRYLPHLHQGLSALDELHILNCCKLASVNGLNNLTSLQTLSIKHCPEIQLSPS